MHGAGDRDNDPRFVIWQASREIKGYSPQAQTSDIGPQVETPRNGIGKKAQGLSGIQRDAACCATCSDTQPYGYSSLGIVTQAFTAFILR
jgi:hypothetical protein